MAMVLKNKWRQFKAGIHVLRANKARDAKNFRKAASIFARAVDLEPSKFSIWVQLGNCSRDIGDYVNSERAYLKALSMQDGNADLYFQIGTLLRVTGRHYKSLENYNKSFALEPTARAEIAIRELGGSLDNSVSEDVFQRNAKKIFYIEIEDLIIFLRYNTRVTGIQRVVSGLILELIKKENTDFDLEYCCFNMFGDGLRIFDKSQILGLLEYINVPNVDKNHLHILLDALMKNSKTVELRSNDLFMTLGAYWITPDYGSRLLYLKAKGVITATYIYDLIPITHPEYVQAATVALVKERLLEISLFSDFFLTISSFVGEEVSELIRLEFNKSKPVFPVPLPHEIPEDVHKKNAPELRSDVIHIATKPYVLCVCTIEGRKNHILLHRIWSALIQKYGRDTVPDLVLVGKWGWAIDEFRAQCDKDQFLDAKIKILSGLNDDELTHLYKHCMFTTFPSFVEGWGLPIGESANFGKLCLSSNTSSMPEVVGEFADYFNPCDFLDAYSKIEKVIFDTAYLAARNSHIATQFAPRSWKAFSDNFLSAVNTALQTVAAPDGSECVAPLRAGELRVLNSQKLSASYPVEWADIHVKFAAYKGWHSYEPWGCWSNIPDPEIRFKVGEEYIGKTVRVYLCLRVLPISPDSSGVAALEIADSRSSKTLLRSLTLDSKWIVFFAKVDDKKVVCLNLNIIGKIEQPEHFRNLYIGLSGIGWHGVDDDRSHLKIVDAILGIDEEPSSRLPPRVASLVGGLKNEMQVASQKQP